MVCFIVLAVILLKLTNNHLSLQQFPNYKKDWEYLFNTDMKKNGIDYIISDMCHFLHREVFHREGHFFDKEGALAEFPQLCIYERFAV